MCSSFSRLNPWLQQSSLVIFTFHHLIGLSWGSDGTRTMLAVSRTVLLNLLMKETIISSVIVQAGSWLEDIVAARG